MERWFEKSVVYQIYPLSFKDSNNDGYGDIQGIIQQLSYLKLLGIDIIWLSPVYNSPMNDNGYDISDYYEINPIFGTMDDVKELLKKAHELNLKIVMDLVINHTSDEHIWFKEALKGKENPYRDFYIWRETANKIESAFTGSAWEYDELSQQYYFHLYSKKQPDLNWSNPRLRQELYKMVNWWIDIGVDGFRLDVIDLIGKDVDLNITYNGPKLYQYLEELYEQCFKGKNLITIGETPAVTLDRAKLYTQINKPVLDMVFNFDHCTIDEEKGKDKWHLKSLDLNELKQVFKKWQQGLHNHGWNSLFWSNHDSPRIISRFHDEKQLREKQGKMLETLLFFMQGTPYIYQGDEIGMTNVCFDSIEKYKDIETINIYYEKLEKGWTYDQVMKAIHAKSRDNARTPMQWDDGEYASFSNVLPWIDVNANYKEINVLNNLQNKNSLFYYYQKLIQLRKKLDIIIHGSFELIDEKHKEIFAYKRIFNNQTLYVVCNFYNKETNIHLDLKNYQLIISNYDNLNLTSKLRPYESFVLLEEK